MAQAIDCKQYSGTIPPEVWAEVRPFVAEAAAYAHWEFLPEDVLESLWKNEQQVWVVRKEGKIVFVWATEILQQSGRKIVIVTSASGEMEHGWSFWPWMSQWMIGNEITEAEVYCRPSMARLLRSYGLKTKYEVLSITPMETV